MLRGIGGFLVFLLSLFLRLFILDSVMGPVPWNKFVSFFFFPFFSPYQPLSALSEVNGSDELKVVI